jgi:hypothetical protein
MSPERAVNDVPAGTPLFVESGYPQTLGVETQLVCVGDGAGGPGGEGGGGLGLAGGLGVEGGPPPLETGREVVAYADSPQLR